MNSYSTKKHFRIVAFMVMISTYLPLIFANLPPFIKSHHIWTIIWFSSLLAFKFRILNQRLITVSVLYGLIVILILVNTLWIDLDEWNRSAIFMEFYEISVGISMLVYFRMEKDYEGLAWLVKWTMIFFVVTAFMSFFTSLINPNYARDIIGVSAAKTEAQREEILSYAKYGGGGYGYASALVCIFPMLMYYFKNIKYSYFHKRILLFMIFIFIVALFSMQIYANIMIALAFIAFSWFGTKNAVRGFITVGAIIIIFMFIPVSFYIDLFQTAAHWFDPNSDLSFKFDDTAAFFATGGSYDETSIGSRAARYPMLWESFMANPLAGHYLSRLKNVDISEGVHLFWMNKLAVFGLLGTIPFAYIIYKYVKLNVIYFDKEFTFYFLLSVFSIITLGAMKTLVGRDLWYTFFVILPGFYYLPILKEKKKSRVSRTRNVEYLEPESNPSP